LSSEVDQLRIFDLPIEVAGRSVLGSGKNRAKRGQFQISWLNGGFGPDLHLLN
jgi:hypothetical protein